MIKFDSFEDFIKVDDEVNFNEDHKSSHFLYTIMIAYPLQGKGINELMQYRIIISKLYKGKKEEEILSLLHTFYRMYNKIQPKSETNRDEITKIYNDYCLHCNIQYCKVVATYLYNEIYTLI